MAPSTLAKVLWINLDRREDRAEAQLRRLEAAGLEDAKPGGPGVETGEVGDGRFLVSPDDFQQRLKNTIRSIGHPIDTLVGT